MWQLTDHQLSLNEILVAPLFAIGLQPSRIDPGAPTRLFHYTSVESLLKIIQCPQFRATGIEYCNDDQEWQLGLKLLTNIVQSRRKERASPVAHWGLDILLTTIKKRAEQIAEDVFITSFSEVSDSLSQWRAYAGGVGGAMIGVRTRGIFAFCENKFTTELRRCLYKEDEQVAYLEILVNEWIKAVEQAPDAWKEYERSVEFADSIVRPLAATIGRFCVVVKDVSFKEEKEWRVAVYRKPKMSRTIHYDSRNFMIRPFLLWPAADINHESARERDEYQEVVPSALYRGSIIEEIWLGPGPYRDISRKALRNAAMLYLGTDEIKASTSSYRT